MSKFSEHISEWKEKYTFLNNIWELYEEFNQSLDGHAKKEDIIRLCKEHTTIENDGEETHNDLCMKLLRNLLLLSKYSNNMGIYSKRCNDLYNWLYHETKSYNLKENILPNIFDRSNSLMQGKDKQNLCSYYLYNKDEYTDEKIIELNIFIDNIERIRDILKNRDSNHYCPCIKYVNNCVKTYKSLDKNYCTGVNTQALGNVKFCDKLKKFTTYYEYLTQEKTIINEIPPLFSEKDTYTNECLSDENMNQLDSTSEKSLVNSTPATASTVVGAMVGIPPFLTLMYKFTPIGQFFRSRHKKGIANNIGENELFYPTTENMNNSSDHTRYNVLYGPVGN